MQSESDYCSLRELQSMDQVPFFGLYVIWRLVRLFFGVIVIWHPVRPLVDHLSIPVSSRLVRIFVQWRRWCASLIGELRQHFCMRQKEDCAPRSPILKESEYSNLYCIRAYIFSGFLPSPDSVTFLIYSAISSYRSACSESLARATNSAFTSSDIF